MIAGTAWIRGQGVAVCGEEVASLTIDLRFYHTSVKNEWAGVVHGHFDRRPGPAPVCTKSTDEVGLLAVALGDGAAHAETPNDVLLWLSIEHRIRVSELDATLPYRVVKDGNGLLPGVAVVLRNGNEDVAHVLLAAAHRAVGYNEILLLVALDDEGLPDAPCLRVLFDAPDHADVRDIAFMICATRLDAA